MNKILTTGFAVFWLCLAAQAREKVIIDTDPAIGYPFRDVDDGLAIALALNSPELEILGVTTIYGNHSQKKTYAKAWELMAESESACGRTARVYRGASKPGQSRETKASRFIRDAVLSYPGEITLIAIGPLTNLAAAIKSDPAVGSSIKRVVSMGGALNARLLGLPPGAFDLNWGADQAATQLVIDSVPEFVMISTDLCMQTVFTKARYQKLASEAPFLREYLAGNIKSWLNFNRLFFHGPEGSGFYPWDTLAVEYVLAPEIFQANLLQVQTRPRPGKAIYIDVGKGTTINAPLQMDTEKFWKIFFARI